MFPYFLQKTQWYKIPQTLNGVVTFPFVFLPDYLNTRFIH